MYPSAHPPISRTIWTARCIIDQPSPLYYEVPRVLVTSLRKYFTYQNSSSRLVTGVSSSVGVSNVICYDGQNRLSQVTNQDSTTLTFAYDSQSRNHLGNRLQRQSSGVAYLRQQFARADLVASIGR